MLERPRHLRELARALREAPVVALLGPRQCGKTTLAGQLAARRKGPVTVLDLERPPDRARLADPWSALEPLRGLVVLDEVQRVPEIFPVLRALVDRGSSTRFLVLGSASPELLHQSSETLAGRILFHELSGFTADEVEPRELTRLWLRGGLPRSLLARDDGASRRWRQAFISTFLERDLALLGVRAPPETMRRLWSMLAHLQGQVLSWSDLGRSLGLVDHAVRRHLEALVQTYMVRLLKPWHENLAKRQVKSPKVYLRDTGILHELLGIDAEEGLRGHPVAGASWEGLALESVVRQLGASERQCYFWATHQGAELDLLVVTGKRRHGFEFKLTSSPAVTRSMHVALADLGLDTLDVVYPGKDTYPLTPKVRAVALQRLTRDLAPLA